MKESLQLDRKDIEEQAATQNRYRKRGRDSEDDNKVRKKETPREASRKPNITSVEETDAAITIFTLI
jgi:hypothetical protein